jgi:hypothetical protein
MPMIGKKIRFPTMTIPTNQLIIKLSFFRTIFLQIQCYTLFDALGFDLHIIFSRWAS